VNRASLFVVRIIRFSAPFPRLFSFSVLSRRRCHCLSEPHLPLVLRLEHDCIVLRVLAVSKLPHVSVVFNVQFLVLVAAGDGDEPRSPQSALKERRRTDPRLAGPGVLLEAVAPVNVNVVVILEED
jgi:hypothetical protein